MSEGQNASDTTNKLGLFQSVRRNSISLGLFAIFTVGLISLTYVITQERIASQIRAYEAKALMEILPAHTHDNSLVDSVITISPSRLLSSQKDRKAWIAYKNSTVAAVILPATAPDGYNGRIELLIGIFSDGSLAGVRAVTHKETPGLGDKINTNVSDWILGFSGKSLINPDTSGWGVKKDGGQFDQFTGATITPRAVVAAVYRSLEYFKENRALLLNQKVNVPLEKQ